MFVLHITIAVLLSILAVAAYDTIRSRILKSFLRRKELEVLPSKKLASYDFDKMPSSDVEKKFTISKVVKAKEEMNLHEQLYYKLHNLEYYPGILPECRELLLSLLSSLIDWLESRAFADKFEQLQAMGYQGRY